MAGATRKLSVEEQSGVDYYRRFHAAVLKRRAAELGAEIDAIAFDVDKFEADLDTLMSADLLVSVLAAAHVADNLLREMFLRHPSPRIDTKALLGPLGPLGDFNKRLKVAALSGLIDTESLAFFDELRKLRNSIAHSPRPAAPNEGQIARLIEASPAWADALISERGWELPGQWRQSPEAFLAASIMQLMMLAWSSLAAPLAIRAGLSLSLLVEQKPAVFIRISKAGVERAVEVLNRARVSVPS